MSIISEKTHEFSARQLTDIYSIAATLLPNSNGIDKSYIEKLVHERIIRQQTLPNEFKISAQRDASINESVKLTDNAKIFQNLTCLLKSVIVVLHLKEENGVVTSIIVHYYDSKQRSRQDCIYCLYNENSNTYSLLQLSNKSNPDEKQSIFDCHNPIVENLLRKFLKDVYKYNEEIQFDGSTDITRQDLHESYNLNDYTLSNKTYEHTTEPLIFDHNESLPIVTNECSPQSPKGNSDLNSLKSVVANMPVHISTKKIRDKFDLLSCQIKIFENLSQLDNQRVSTENMTYPKDKYEFRYGLPLVNDQSILSAVIYLLDRSKSISLQALFENIAYLIQMRSNMNSSFLQQTIDDQGRKVLLTDAASLFNVLTILYPDILFCIISKTNISDIDFFQRVTTYGKNGSIHKKCMFILYDIESDGYTPLYLHDNENDEEAEMNLKFDNFSITILKQFIQKEFIVWENLDFNVPQPSDKIYVQLSADFVSLGVIGSSGTLPTVNEPPSIIVEEKTLSSSTTAAIVESAINESEIMAKFVQQKMLGDGHCLFSSIIFLMSESNSMTAYDLRKNVCDQILNMKSIDKEQYRTNHGKTLEEHCDKIKNSNEWGGELEIEAMVQLYKKSIRIVTIQKSGEKISEVYITEIPSNESLLTQCIYLIYMNRNHYEPLYLEYDNESNKKKMVFGRNDRTVRKLLRIFFQKTYQYNGKIKFFYEKNDRTSSSNSGDMLSSNSTQAPSQLDSSVSTLNIRKRLRSIESNDYENKKTTTEQISSSLDSLSNSNTKYGMKFQKQPMHKFRGRMLSDMEPTKKLNRAGKVAQPRKPTYFPDCENNHWLNLLIPKELLTYDFGYLRAEITVITRDFNGRAYEHPYLVFLVYDQEKIIITNPLYINLADESEYHKITTNSDGSAELKLFLVIIKRKLSELRGIKSLVVYNPSNSSTKKEQIEINNKHSDELIKNYDLHKLHIIATLWKKDSDNGEYHRLGDIPCRSQLIEEDQDFKISEITQKLRNQPS